MDFIKNYDRIHLQDTDKIPIKHGKQLGDQTI